jgi:hypothetical protein
MTTTARDVPTTPRARAIVALNQPVHAFSAPAPTPVPARPPEFETTRLLSVRQAAEIADYIIRPAMEATLTCLAREGGGGRIEERRGDDRHSLRLIPWMAVEGDGATTTCPDRDPYLQLDIDVATRRVDVWSSDIGDQPGSARTMSAWPLSAITGQSLTHRVTDLLRGVAGAVTPDS